MIYREELAFLKQTEQSGNPQNERKIVDEKRLRELVDTYPGLPSTYIDYLREIGSGSFRECQFDVKPYLFDLEDLGIASHYELPTGIKFFGDNYSGDFAGFDFNSGNDLVIEFWYEDGTIYETGESFHQYIRSQMLMDEHGNDLRIL